jgi:hypothetical protein
MSKVDSYLSHLGNATRHLGNIIVLEAEMKLLELKITDFENHIKENERVIATAEWADDKQKNVLMLSNNEYELRILELQTKIKLNGIMITRTKMMRG